MQERDFVHSFDLLRRRGQRGGGVAILAGRNALPPRQCRKLGENIAEGRVRPFVPGDLECATSLDGLPVGVRDDGNATRGADALR